MREILFRGQTRRKGEKVKMDGTPVESNWVYGGVLQGTGEHSIIYGCNDPDDKGAANLDKWPVYTDTIGQYTGLKDKNGKRIFEGDICRNTRTKEIVSVKWHGTMAGYVWHKQRESKYLYDFGELFRACDKCEVIGNIHDNPELMDGGAE